MPTERQKLVLSQLLAQRATDTHAIVTDGLAAISAELAALAEPRTARAASPRSCW
jgi:hypothetical protein